jgi:hypothetical protein
MDGKNVLNRATFSVLYRVKVSEYSKESHLKGSEFLVENAGRKVPQSLSSKPVASGHQGAKGS